MMMSRNGFDLKTMQYNTFSKRYAPAQIAVRPNGPPVRDRSIDNPSPPAARMANRIIAARTDNLPAAIGLLHLYGCSRSYLRSQMSFSVYTALDSRQKAATAHRQCFQHSGSCHWLANSKGAMINMFLIQWDGRIVTIIALIKVTFPSSGCVLEFSTACKV